MKYSRLLRTMLCLVLVCCLVIHASPLRVDASAVVGAEIVKASVVTGNPYIIAGAALAALGIYAGVETGAFDGVIQSAVSHLESLGNWIEDRSMSLLKVVSNLGTSTYYVPCDLFQELQNFVFSSGVLSGSFSNTDSVPVTWMGANTRYSADQPIVVGVARYLDSFGRWRSKVCIFAANPGTFKANGNKVDLIDYGGFYGYSGSAYSHSSMPNTTSNLIWDSPSGDMVDMFFSCPYIGAFTTSLDLSIGNVTDLVLDASSVAGWSQDYANRQIRFSESSDGGSSGDGNDDWKMYLPLGLAGTAAGILATTQVDQMLGVADPGFIEDDTETEYDVVDTPVVDGYQGLVVIPSTNTGAGTGSGAGSGSGTGTGEVVAGSVAATSWATFTEWLSTQWTGLIDTVKAIPDAFSTWFYDLISAVRAIPAEFSTWLEGLLAGVNSIIDTIGAIPASIAEAIAAVFVPSPDYVTVKVESLLSRFGWIAPIVDYAKALSGEFLGSTPPVIYVHLQDSEGSYNLGGTVKFLDMTWYSRYKSQGDAIISGFLWALFVWRMYIKLPGIINGVAGDIGSMTYGEAKWQQADNREKRRNRYDK